LGTRAAVAIARRAFFTDADDKVNLCGGPMAGFQLQRLGLMMEPEPGNPQEVEGVLNPAGVRGPDGHFYLFRQLVAKGNYSRIGIARVKFNQDGDPAGVERLGIALEPTKASSSTA
jgi:hypothetical protein